MIRLVNLFLLCGCVLALVGVYTMKYRTEKIAEEAFALEARIAQKTERLGSLKADWAYLDQPSAIEPIVSRHAEVLGIEPISATQYVRIVDLPMRPAEPDPGALADLLDLLETGFDAGAQGDRQ